MAGPTQVAATNEQNLLIQQGLDKKAAQKRMVEIVIPFLGLVFIFVFFSIVTQGGFLSPVNVENLINQSFALTIIAIGASFVYAHGGTDMSVGATTGVGQLVLAMLLRAGAPIGLAVIACIAVTVLGASMVAGITLKLNVPVFIGSMCVRTSFLGVLQYITTSDTVFVDYNQYAYMNNPVVKVLILLVFVVAGYYLFSFTSFGKYNKAIGGNEVTAIQAGVKKKRLVLAAFLFLGFCVGVSAIFSFFRVGRVTGTSGTGVEFNIMIAMALGGVPLRGGDKTRVVSAIIGALSITFLVNGLMLWGLTPAVTNGVKGLLFIIIIALSYDRSAGKLVS